MTSKLISLSEAVRRFAWDGMQYASGAALPVGSDAIDLRPRVAAPEAQGSARRSSIATASSSTCSPPPAP